MTRHSGGMSSAAVGGPGGLLTGERPCARRSRKGSGAVLSGSRLRRLSAVDGLAPALGRRSPSSEVGASSHSRVVHRRSRP